MKKAFSSISIGILFSVFTITSCKTTSNTTETLPKDISEKPLDESSQKNDHAQLEKLKAEITKEIAKEPCADPNEWAFSPMGAKACGGPVSYIAYPKKLEAVILPKIQEYTDKMSQYNKNYNIVSDCMMVNEPVSIKCENGQAVLEYQ
ncbi:hypothetical protein [uncultured Chryseobacterium sp.]|mgnify:CR=1 FL=1|jgi:hypothetical protein|uniref:hypothetical protein n=1 Tax=uncultured Chryseobacterium sp. TaxID=259322 RepID=UPI00261F80D1|nr:hypothetical protein [uncultured Chryseobacterium sp.]